MILHRNQLIDVLYKIHVKSYDPRVDFGAQANFFTPPMWTGFGSQTFYSLHPRGNNQMEFGGIMDFSAGLLITLAGYFALDLNVRNLAFSILATNACCDVRFRIRFRPSKSSMRALLGATSKDGKICSLTYDQQSESKAKAKKSRAKRRERMEHIPEAKQMKANLITQNEGKHSRRNQSWSTMGQSEISELLLNYYAKLSCHYPRPACTLLAQTLSFLSQALGIPCTTGTPIGMP